jgi:hypothetical protein
MKKKMVCLSAAALLMISLSGCATMFGEKTQKLTFKSKPAGAEVVLGTQTCTTPCSITVEKSKLLHTISLSKDGYQSHDVVLSGSIDSYYYGPITETKVFQRNPLSLCIV